MTATLDLAGVEHGPGACLDAAAKRPQQLNGQVLINLDDISLIDQCMAGEGGLAKDMTVHLRSRGVGQRC